MPDQSSFGAGTVLAQQRAVFGMHRSQAQACAWALYASSLGVQATSLLLMPAIVCALLAAVSQPQDMRVAN